MKKIMITGCNGQLGRSINKKLKEINGVTCINTDVDELNITDIEAVSEFVKMHEPYAIINCAAHTAVDLCETETDKAFLINAIGPRNLSIAAKNSGAKLIHISTDYVFDGKGESPYTEFDRVNPTGAYGKSKLAGENFVKEFCNRYFILRTAWLYGEGKNFLKTMLHLAESRDCINVVHDEIGSPTSTDEVSDGILALLFTDQYGLYHATCEGSCSWAEFAAEIFKMAGRETEVKPISAKEYGAAAPRPSYSVLDNMMFRLNTNHKFSDWKAALRNYFNDYEI